MKISEFNKSSLLEKQRYLKQFVSAVPYITGVVVFENYRILTIYSIGGELIECEAYPHDEPGRDDALRLLNGKVCVAIDCNNLPGIKEAISNKLFKATGMLN